MHNRTANSAMDPFFLCASNIHEAKSLVIGCMLCRSESYLNFLLSQELARCKMLFFPLCRNFSASFCMLKHPIFISGFRDNWLSMRTYGDVWLQSWQILYTFVLRPEMFITKLITHFLSYTKFVCFPWLYFPYFTTFRRQT